MNMRHMLLATATLAVAGCDYGVPSEVVDGVVVYSAPSTGADFTPFNTYQIDLTVTVRKDGIDLPDDAMPASVEAAIADQMDALGYTRVFAPSAATVGLKLGYAVNSVDYYYSGGYCDYYYYYYCYYPPVYAGTYKYGTAILAMVDLGYVPPATPPGNDGNAGLWFSVMYGVLYDYSPTGNTTRLVEGINRAFSQSPYLAVVP